MEAIFASVGKRYFITALSPAVCSNVKQKSMLSLYLGYKQIKNILLLIKNLHFFIESQHVYKFAVRQDVPVLYHKLFIFAIFNSFLKIIFLQ